jgi:hypothetical protein
MNIDIINSLIIKTEGEINVIGEYNKQIELFKNHCIDIKIKKFETFTHYKNSFILSKNIKLAQDRIKEIMISLDNQEIQILKEKLIEINKILASKNTENKKYQDEYKETEKLLIIENAFTNIRNQINFEPNFDIFYKECILQFKGKSNFEEMQEIALKISEDYNLKLEVQQLKYQNTFNDLKIFCESKNLQNFNYLIEIESKKIVEKGKKIEEVKQEIENRIKLETEQKIKQETILKKEIIEKASNLKEYYFYILLNEINLKNLKVYLEENNITYKFKLKKEN